MIGFHFQTPVRDWPDAIKILPKGTWCKSVNDLHLCRDFKKHNPGVKTVYRYEYNKKQHLGDQKDETLTRKARDFFNKFIDGTFYEQELYKYIDGIEEWNEYLATSQSEEETQLWVRWCKAVNEVWTNEYRSDPRLSHIRLVSCNTAIGNEIDTRFAKIVQEHDGILSYHNYTLVKNKKIASNDWNDLSGRWTVMDAKFRKAGVTVNWLMTEGGPFTSVYDGWRDDDIYDGDIEAHINGQIKYQIDNCSEWNKKHNNRMLGQVLFTVGPTGTWEKYEYTTSNMKKIAAFLQSYSPEIPPIVDPPTQPPTEDLTAWKKQAWYMSEQEQRLRGIRLNSKAAIQEAVEADDMHIVTNELNYKGKVFQPAESYTKSPPRRVYVWEPAKTVWWFEDPT